MTAVRRSPRFLQQSMTFTDLPDDMLRMIGGRVSIQDALHLASASVNMQALFSNNLRWDVGRLLQLGIQVDANTLKVAQVHAGRLERLVRAVDDANHGTGRIGRIQFHHHWHAMGQKLPKDMSDAVVRLLCIVAEYADQQRAVVRLIPAFLRRNGQGTWADELMCRRLIAGVTDLKMLNIPALFELIVRRRTLSIDTFDELWTLMQNIVNQEKATASRASRIVATQTIMDFREAFRAMTEIEANHITHMTAVWVIGQTTKLIPMMDPYMVKLRMTIIAKCDEFIQTIIDHPTLPAAVAERLMQEVIDIADVIA